VKRQWRVLALRVRNRLSSSPLSSDILAAFILGLVIGRRRVLQEAERHRKRLGQSAIAGISAAAVGTVLVYTWDPDGWMGSLLYPAQDYGLTVFYVCGISWLYVSRDRIRDALRVFAAPGRIGLTNYLMQSAVMAVLFERFGFDFPWPSTVAFIVLNLAFYFGVQVPFSRWWVEHYHFGPAEWVWRSLTYGQRQPWRRGST
jgi:uncharacterized protein